MKNKKVLVTGGAGYIGSHACVALEKAGYEPIIYDNLSTGYRDLAQNFKLIVGDIIDKAKLDKLFLKYNFLGVFHFAASAYIGESVNYPQKYYYNNVVNTLNLLDICLKNNVKYFVFSSSCATYGNPITDLISENEIQAPINPYGRSKLIIEWILKDYQLAYQMKPMILRYFNVAGADKDGNIGERHIPETHLIPLIFDALSDKTKELTIFGDDYKTPDGTCIRDYIHVTDLASAHILAFQELLNGGEPDCYNIGVGQGYSVMEVINAASIITGKYPNIIIGNRRLGDPAKLVSNPQKITEHLKWSPQFYDIKKILKSAWDWYTKDKRIDC